MNHKLYGTLESIQVLVVRGEAGEERRGIRLWVLPGSALRNAIPPRCWKHSYLRLRMPAYPTCMYGEFRVLPVASAWTSEVLSILYTMSDTAIDNTRRESNISSNAYRSVWVWGIWVNEQHVPHPTRLQEQITDWLVHRHHTSKTYPATWNILLPSWF